MNRIVLIDLSQRELNKRQELQKRASRLSALDATKATSGGLTEQQEEELKLLRKQIDSDVPVDPLYQSVAAHVARRPWDDLVAKDDYVLKHGIFGSQRGKPVREALDTNEREIAAICGLLQLDSLLDPAQRDFTRRITLAQGEYRQHEPLFGKAFEAFSQKFTVKLGTQIDAGLLSENVIGCITPDHTVSSRKAGSAISAASTSAAAATGGTAPTARRPDDTESTAAAPSTASVTTPVDPVPDRDDTIAAVSARDLAQMVRRLAADGISASDKYLAKRMDSAFEHATGVGTGAAPSSIEIDLPDLEEVVDDEIIKENLIAIQAMYFSCLLEETRIFQVVERIVELFRQGLLPLGRGPVGDYLFNYYKKTSERITEGERRDLYLRAFGAPGGSAVGIEPNREFNELWLRFVSAVSSFARQQTVERLLRNATPMAVSQEQVRKAGRDLGANLSRNGYGIAHFAATDLQQSISEFKTHLSDAELRGAFGARDMWQVIDFVNVNYLGGPRNTHRYRTQSRAGAIIIRWIAERAPLLSNPTGPVLSIDQLVNPQVRAAYASSNPMRDPSDWDLVNACEQWLAVGGVQDPTVEQYSQPIESPTMTSRPLDMPQMARDVLDQVGMSLPTT